MRRARGTASAGAQVVAPGPGGLGTACRPSRDLSKALCAPHLWPSAPQATVGSEAASSTRSYLQRRWQFSRVSKVREAIRRRQPHKQRAAYVLVRNGGGAARVSFASATGMYAPPLRVFMGAAARRCPRVPKLCCETSESGPLGRGSFVRGVQTRRCGGGSGMRVAKVSGGGEW